MSITYPRIHLVMDTCFGVKRWVKPSEWMQIIDEIGGIRCIQASTDNEIDPLFCSEEYREKWLSDVIAYGQKYEMKVVSFYSGYATYRTVGLAGDNESTWEKLKHTYFKGTVDLAAKIGAGVGNTLGAFSMPVLDNPDLYEKHKGYLKDNLSEMAEYAKEKQVQFSYEQMYSPIQGFWTIANCKQWIRDVYEVSGCPMYITIDTAHQVGQTFYRKPDDISKPNINLPLPIKHMVDEDVDENTIFEALKKYDYYFSEEKDSDVYAWFEELGAYSPIVHLQQTDGSFSAHRPFISKYNQDGIIHPEKVLKAIAKSYQSLDPSLPAPADDIYLAYELFFGVHETRESIIQQLRESVEYWRQVIAEDGKRIDELIDVSAL